MSAGVDSGSAGASGGPTWVDFAQVTAILERLSASDAETRATLDEVVAELTRRRKTTRPWNWATLSADEAESCWTELGGWVWDVAHRHALTSWLPCCWAEHPYLVEELAVLRLVWLAAYTGPAASVDVALGWLEALERFRVRIQDRDKGRCRAGHVTGGQDADGQATAYPDWSEPEPWRAAFEETVRRDVQARHAALHESTNVALTQAQS